MGSGATGVYLRFIKGRQCRPVRFLDARGAREVVNAKPPMVMTTPRA